MLFALGRWDSLHHNDEPDRVAQGLTGHTIYYDAKRLTRLLKLLNYSDIAATTFNAGHGPSQYRNLFTRTAAITLFALSHIIPSSRQVLLVSVLPSQSSRNPMDECREHKRGCDLRCPPDHYRDVQFCHTVSAVPIWLYPPAPHPGPQAEASCPYFLLKAASN